jgi:hypothetical protein
LPAPCSARNALSASPARSRLSALTVRAFVRAQLQSLRPPSHACSRCLIILSSACAPIAAFARLSSLSPQELYASLVAKDCTAVLSGDFGGQRLTPGVYCLASPATFSQNVILDASAPGSFVFKIGGAFDAVATRSIVAVNGAPEVFYAVSGAVTLGAGSRVYGTIVATAAITLGIEASIGGQALSLISVVNIGAHATIGPQLLRQANLPLRCRLGCRFLPRSSPLALLCLCSTRRGCPVGNAGPGW